MNKYIKDYNKFKNRNANFLEWTNEDEIIYKLNSFKERKIKNIYSEILPDEIPDFVPTYLYDYFINNINILNDFEINLNVNEEKD